MYIYLYILLLFLCLLFTDYRPRGFLGRCLKGGPFLTLRYGSLQKGALLRGSILPQGSA